MYRRRLPRFPRRCRAGLAFVALATLIVVGITVCTRANDGDGGRPPEASATAAASSTTLAVASPTTTPPVALPSLAVDRTRLQPAEVVDVIDGDTIDIRISGREERVRYYGIDTPERGDHCYREARERNEELAGEAVMLLPDARARDRYGRLLRYVFSGDGSSIDARLIAEGLAYAWREDGAYREQLVELEGEARSASVGCLWE